MSDNYDEIEDCTAQDVVDALRFLFMAQADPQERMELVHMFFEFAPETDNNRGIRLITRLLAEGSLKLSVA